MQGTPFYSTDSDESEIPGSATDIIAGFRNYPNPFNPQTSIYFQLRSPSNITLDIYNMRGQKITELLSGVIDAGEHSVIWDGTDSTGKPVTSGIYFYKLATDSCSKKDKMLLLK